MLEIQTTKEQIESQGGMVLVGKVAKKMGIGEVTSWEKKPTGAILTQLFGMFAQGETSFEASRHFRGNDFMKDALDLPMIYSPETVRIYLESMCDVPESVANITAQLEACSARLLEKAAITPIKTGQDQHHQGL